MTVTGSINEQTFHHSQAIHNARMEAIRFITGLDTDTQRQIEPLLRSWNDVNEHFDRLLNMEVAQRRYLEAFCQNQQAKAEARS